MYLPFPPSWSSLASPFLPDWGAPLGGEIKPRTRMEGTASSRRSGTCKLLHGKVLSDGQVTRNPSGAGLKRKAGKSDSNVFVMVQTHMI